MLNFKQSKNKITFVDGRFYFDQNDNYVPSVTTILEAYPKPYALLQWIKENGENSDKIRDAKGDIGSAVHRLTENYDNGFDCNLLDLEGSPLYSLEVWSMFERYVDFTNRFNPVHNMIEQNIININLGYAGTLDRVSNLNGKKFLIDIKTSNGVYNSFWLQLAAYRELLKNEGIEVDGVAILWLNAKTRSNGSNGAIQGMGWQLLQKDDTTEDFMLFEAVKKLWLAENKNAKPKEFSYQLNHKKIGA